jgi:hypothetical protein
VVSAGVYFIEAASSHTPSIRFLAAAGGTPKMLVQLDKPVHQALTVSPDGSRLLYTQFEPVDTDLMIVRRFR